MKPKVDTEKVLICTEREPFENQATDQGPEPLGAIVL